MSPRALKERAEQDSVEKKDNERRIQAAEKEPKGTEAIITTERATIIADLELSMELQAQEESFANDYSFKDEYLQKINGPEEDNWSVVLAGFNYLKNNLFPEDPKDTKSKLKNAPIFKKTVMIYDTLAKARCW